MEGNRLTSAALTAVQSATVTGLAKALLLGQSGPAGFLFSVDVAGWDALAFLSLFCTVGAFFVQNAALRRSSPTRVGFLMGTEPLFGFALGWAILSEPTTPASVLGAGLIVSGSFIALSAERRP
ncbi:DMT family transporter [Paracoccus ravus]|uniref:DMT family transporter n=1 Tax=Paracoccus ravus TaxID=2447760 RepID=UPI001AD9E057|nr:DMT family transporter [Paracoccus ravus]